MKTYIGDLLWAVEDETGIPARDVRRVLHALKKEVRRQVLEGHDVVWPGVCKLELVERAERRAKNVNTGEVETFPAHVALRAAPSRELAKKVKESD